MPRGKPKEVGAFKDDDLDEEGLFEPKEVGDEPGEEIPKVTSAEDPPKKRMGRPVGSKNRKKSAAVSAKLPIPPAALQALGSAPYLLAGTLYGSRTGRSLDFTNPEQIATMYRASFAALEAWMAEAGVEAPAWLVWAGTTSMCIGSAIVIDQMKMKAEIAMREQMPRDPRAKQETEAAVAAAAQNVGGVATVDLTKDAPVSNGTTGASA